MAAHGTSAGSTGAFYKAYQRKWTFLVTFVLVFFVTFSVLATLDVVPNSVSTKHASQLAASPVVAQNAIVAPVAPELPTRVEIPTINLKATIENPNTTDVAKLDQALLSGAVRYPTSAKLNELGNVIIFGHSSYLPIVHNQAFKTFDGIQKLKVGDQVMVYSSDAVYTYSVESVTKEDASADAIPLTVSGSKLTLATCDSFGQKTDRFVVVANLVESHSLGN